MMRYPCEKEHDIMEKKIDLQDNMFNGVELQELRDMRHRDYCSEHEGKVSICKICNQKVSTVDIMKSCSDYIFQQYKHVIIRNKLSNKEFLLKKFQVN